MALLLFSRGGQRQRSSQASPPASTYGVPACWILHRVAQMSQRDYWTYLCKLMSFKDFDDDIVGTTHGRRLPFTPEALAELTPPSSCRWMNVAACGVADPRRRLQQQPVLPRSNFHEETVSVHAELQGWDACSTLRATPANPSKSTT
jgi:hypothetical protein